MLVFSAKSRLHQVHIKKLAIGLLIVLVRQFYLAFFTKKGLGLIP